MYVLLAADSRTGLSVTSAAVFNEIRADDGVRLTKRLGTVDEETMDRADEAIRISLGSRFPRYSGFEMLTFFSDQPVLDLTEETDAQTLTAIDDGIARLEAARGITLAEMRKELSGRCSK